MATVTWTGKTGQKYQFTAYTLTATLPNSGGVYIFTKQDGNQYNSLYIGQTNHLPTRIPNHEKWDCVRRHGVNTLCILENSSAVSRLRIESDIIDAGKPPCND